MVERDDDDEESGAAVNLFDMTVADSDPSLVVTPRHRLAVESTQPTRVDNPSANRCAALREDDPRGAARGSCRTGRVAGLAEVVDMATPRGHEHQDRESSTSCSDTDSVSGKPFRRRLTLLSREVQRRFQTAH